MAPIFLIVAYDGDPFPQLKDALKAQGVAIDLRVRGKDSLAFDPEQHTGLIILGDEKSPTKAEFDCFRAAKEAEVPILGICAGAQVISKALKGKIGTHDELTDSHNPIEVYFTVEGVSDPVISCLLEHPFTIQHHFWTATAPPRAVPLAYSSHPTIPHCEAFRVGRAIYGLQFHPEVSPTSYRKEEWFPKGLKAEVLREVCNIGSKVLDAWVVLAVRETC